MEKKRKVLYTMFTKWSLSYVVIATMAILIISFCSIQYSQALRAELEYTNAVQLEMTRLQMDRNVRSLRSFSSKAALNKTVSSLRKQTSWDYVSRYELYRLVKELAGETLLDGVTSDCYLYFPDIDLLVSGQYYNHNRDFYDIALGSYGFSFEDWQAVIGQNYRTSQVFSLQTKDGGELAVLVKPLDSSNRQTPPANAIMVMDLSKIPKASNRLSQERELICLIDRTNKRLVSSSPVSEEMKDELLSREPEKLIGGGGRIRGQSYDSSVISCISSQYENWDYAVVTQEQELVGKINELSMLVLVLSLLYLLISGGAIGYAALRQYRPIRNIVDTLKRSEGESEQQMSVDAYDYINRSIHKLVDQNREISSVAKQQQNAISRELFHRLLTERDAYASMDEGILKRMGICKDGDGVFFGMILTYRLEENVELALDTTTADPVDTREMSWFILQNVTAENLEKYGCSHVCFREGRREQIFFCWTEEDGQDLKAAVRQALEMSTAFISQYFKLPYRAAVSDPHQGIGSIYQSYREVRRVFEYQKSEGGREVISFGEINLLPMDTLLKYPMDAQNRLAQSVSDGDIENAWQEILKLLEDNQVNCLAPEAMQFLVSNIAVSILRVVGKVSRDTALPVSQRAVMEACQQGDLEKMKRELERLVETACQEVSEFNKREKENQKGKLYWNAKAYVEEYYTDPGLSVNSMAEYFGVQATYLSKLFKEMEGDKLSLYIHRVRLSHVKELLSKDVKLEDIAQQCGFGSQRTFLRIFKQYEGITPTQYKELQENKGKEESV